MPKLILFAEPNKVRQVSLTDVETSIGRAPDNSLVIGGNQVSRFHAVMFMEAGVVTLKDLNSQNGVHVNGARVRTRVLKSGDEIMIGDCKMRFLAADIRVSSAEALRLLTIPGVLTDLDARRYGPAPERHPAH